VNIKRSTVFSSGTTLFSRRVIEPRPIRLRLRQLAPRGVDYLRHRDRRIVGWLEGQTVEKERTVARLISIDAELDVEQAENSLAIRAR